MVESPEHGTQRGSPAEVEGRQPQSAEPAAAHASPMGQVIKEILMLWVGLLVGYFWRYLYARPNGLTETQNIIIGLFIIICFMFRYIGLVRHADVKTVLNKVPIQFFRELIIFLVGLLFGLFWYIFFERTKDLDIHIIIVQLVLIFSMARYLVLLRRNISP